MQNIRKIVTITCYSITLTLSYWQNSIASDDKVSEFLSNVEDTLDQLSHKNNLAWWDAESYISTENDKAASATQQSYDTFLLQSAIKARKLSDSSPINQRKLNLLRLSSAGILKDEGENSRRTELVLQMTNNFSKACVFVDSRTPCLTREKIADQLIKSRDPVRLKQLWTAWYDSAIPVGNSFSEYVRLTNKGARDSGYDDAAVMSRANYEVDPNEFLKDIEDLYAELQPLYRMLHAYVRSKLVNKYGPSIVDPAKPIPIHLVGNLWGQDWEGIYDLVKLPGASLDYGKVLMSQKLKPREYVNVATNFFESIGFPKLPNKFNQNSHFSRPRQNFVCHPTAWLITPGDYRLKMCIEENWSAFITVHHEMGHIFDYQSFAHQPKLFRRSPNNGISEAVGDALTLSITPEYLKKIGFVSDQIKDQSELNGLLRIALRKLVRIQFGLMLQKWRWGVMSGEISPDRYNDAWWELVKQYQGLVPPSPRPSKAFDPGAKFHVAADVDYIRYFLADVLTFQIHEALSKEADCKLPINQCTIYGNRSAGLRLKSALTMGASKPWGEMLSVLTGKNKISGESIQSYLNPLEKYLKKEIAGVPVGW